MAKVVIVGEIYEQNVQVGGGPMPGGGGPVDPGYGRPDWVQGHPGNRPPGSWSGNYPTGGPVYPGGPTDPGYGQGHPSGGHISNWVPGSGNYPTGGPIVPPQGGTDVPEDVYTPAPVPEEIASQYVVTVYDPKTMTYTTKAYPPR